MSLDEHGYPDEEALEEIRTYDVTADLEGFLTLVKDNWWAADWGFERPAVDKLELHTGGWSGNEDVIASMEGNTHFFTLCLARQEPGGHYYFDLKVLQ